MCVGCGVAAVAKIGLDFDDSGHEPHAIAHAPNEATVDQSTTHDPAIERVEILAKRRAERHFISIGEIMARAPGSTACSVAGRSCVIWHDFPLDSIRSRRGSRGLETFAGEADDRYAVGEIYRTGRAGRERCETH